MRKNLVSIQTIKEVLNHPKADVLEIAVIKGWQCVVGLGEFKAGDTCVFFEVDSFIPDTDERFEFLRKSCVNKQLQDGIEYNGFRLKTIKLRGEISQGLAKPLSQFDELPKDIPVGTDVTKVLNVRKWDPDLPKELLESALGNFPSDIRKTDLDRIQNVWDEYKNDPIISEYTFEETEKLNGASKTVFVNDGVFGVAGKNINYKTDGNNNMVRIARNNKLDIKLASLEANIAVQGEFFKEKNSKDKVFRIFNVFDIQHYANYTPELRRTLIDSLELTHVPVLRKKVKVFKDFDTIEDLLAYANGTSFDGGKREGLVYKCNEKPSLAFKVISNAFLLKEK